MQIIYNIRGVYNIKGKPVSGKNSKKMQLESIDTQLDDKDVVNFCLSCTKPECKSGECKELKEFLKERRKNE